MQIGVITNPNSRKNRLNPGRAAKLRAILGSAGEVHETDSVDSIKPVLRDFLRKRARYWVADGGDGALHWMVRQGMEVLGEDEFRGQPLTLPITLPTKGGTIDFVANNVGIEGNAEGLLAMLRHRVERGYHIADVEVDSMAIDGIERTADGDTAFRTFGFAVAAGGVGQRFFTKYYEDADPNPRTIVKVIANTVASMPVALSPLRHIPGVPTMLASYARDIFEPTPAQVSIDGMILPSEGFTGIHVASMSINLGGILKFFGKADEPGLMHAIVGSPSPLAVLRNLPRMHSGKDMVGKDILDRACRELTMEATSDQHLAPIIDGETYPNVRKMTFRIGPRVRIPKLVANNVH